MCNRADNYATALHLTTSAAAGLDDRRLALRRSSTCTPEVYCGGVSRSDAIGHQVRGALASETACPECGRTRRHKDARDIVVRSLFGTLNLASPRWWHCACAIHEARTFSPLAELLPERSTPELVYLESKFAGLAVSYTHLTLPTILRV